METRFGYDEKFTSLPSHTTKTTSASNNLKSQGEKSEVSSPYLDGLPFSLEDLLKPIYPPYQQIHLHPCQIDCFNRMIAQYRTQYSMLTPSPTGSGKTVVGLAVCAKLGLNPMIVAPPGTKATWDRECHKYGFYDYIFIGYQSLSGKSNNLNHDYLTRNNKEYKVTEYLKKIINHGIMLILDETQLAKNGDTGINKSCHTIVNQIVRSGSKSRILLMSATPYDKVAFSQSILKLLGVITARKMFDFDLSTQEHILEGYGFRQLTNLCQHFDRQTTNKILQEMPKISKDAIAVASEQLFIDVIKPRYVAKIIPVYPTKVDAANGYYNVNNFPKVIEILNSIKRILGYDEASGTISNKIDYGLLAKAMHLLEEAKLEIIYRLAISTLQQHPTSKVIIYLWHHNTTDIMMEWLKNYNPLKLNGTVHKNNKPAIIESFQEPNLNHRVMIAHPISGGNGIDLDDQDGNFPRFMFIIPTYNLIDSTQAMGRVKRMSSKSDSVVRFVYVNPLIGNNKEDKVYREDKMLNALVQKALTVRRVVDDDSPILMPGELRKEYETV